MIRVTAFLLFSLLMTFSAAAQDTYWVQIEARQTLTSAQERAREYARRLDSVNGFYLGEGWYGIFIGPFTESGTVAELARLRSLGAIPDDSFVKNGRLFKQQFWPIGGGTQVTKQQLPDPTTPAAPPAITIEPIAIPDETPKEALATERLLSREEREELQRALQWAGFYEAAIDGSFGRGTRASMEAWQRTNNEEPTGILTTKQRAALLNSYNKVLQDLNLRFARDDASGIQMLVPTSVVSFSAYKPPFVHFDATVDTPAKVIFISQTGDQARLFGLYEIMQTLDIIPPDGPRNRSNNAFEIEGVGNGIHSYTTVSLRDGEIKGFTLVWPEGDEQRRSRLLQEMISSFERLNGTLDPNIVPPSEDQAIDMVSGLEIRKPQSSRTGFFIDNDGLVLTTLEAVQSCARITFDEEDDAQVIYSDPELKIAVLRPDTALTPVKVSEFQRAVPLLRSTVAVAGFPYGGALVMPTLTFGQLTDIRGLNGEETIKRLAMTTQQGDAGGPVFDEGGAVLGMLLPRADGTSQVLPTDVNFMVDSDEIFASLSAAGITIKTTEKTGSIPAETLSRHAADMTVLVSCW